jgi:hypothetical protein
MPPQRKRQCSTPPRERHLHPAQQRDQGRYRKERDRDGDLMLALTLVLDQHPTAFSASHVLADH